MPILKIYDESTSTWVDIPTVQGLTGPAAGFGTPTASIDNTSGTPSVSVTASGSDISKIFSFAFSGLKGPKGDPATEFYYGVAEPTDPDVKFWMNPAGENVIHEVPSGGSSGQFLGKESDSDYEINWIDVAALSSSDIDAILEG